MKTLLRALSFSGSLLVLALSAASPSPPADSIVERARSVVEKTEAMEGVQGLLNVEGLNAELQEMALHLAAHRESHPDDAQAWLLGARLGRLIDLSDVRMRLVSAAEQRERLGELQGLLDRALALEKTNAEAHFWKARLFVDLADPGVLPEREDLDAAIREAGEAVRLAPEVLAYREALAMYFVINQQDAAVVELMQAAPGGRHPYHLLLRQLGEIPVPPGAVAVQSSARNFAATEEMKGRITDYPAFRVRAYVVPLSANEIEAFYRSKWPSFRFSKQNSERVDGGGRMQIHMTSLRWSSGGLEPLSAREARSIAANSPEIEHMVAVVLAEMRNLPESSLEYTPGIENFDRASRKLFSQLVLVNYRKLDPAPP